MDKGLRMKTPYKAVNLVLDGSDWRYSVIWNDGNITRGTVVGKPDDPLQWLHDFIIVESIGHNL